MNMMVSFRCIVSIGGERETVNARGFSILHALCVINAKSMPCENVLEKQIRCLKD